MTQSEALKVSDQIRQRRNWALRIIREREELGKNIRKLEDEANTISMLLAKVSDGGRVEQSELATYGLVDASSYVVKLRLKGLLREKNAMVESLRMRHRNIGETLSTLSVCPSCEGQGTLSHMHYERSDGIISTSSRVEVCALCGGRGRIFLGDDVQQALETQP
jgi:DnaJ-class molecular chaperone